MKLSDVIPVPVRRRVWIDRDAWYGPHYERETFWAWRGRRLRYRAHIEK